MTALWSMSTEPSQQRSDFALCVQGGVGDFVVIARFWRDFLAQVGGGSFDVYCFSFADMAQLIFGAIPGCNHVLDGRSLAESVNRYRWVFRANQMLFVEGGTALPFLRLDSIGGNKDDQIARRVTFSLQKILPIAQNHPRLDGALASYAFFKNRSRRDFLHFMAGIPYGGDRFPIGVDADVPRQFGLTPGGYMTLHNGFSANIGSVWSTKSFRRWPDVIARIREAGIGLPIVQIGEETSSAAIAGADVMLIGKTNLPQATALVGSARFHLDVEGGFVHLAAAMGIQSCVIFGPTSPAFFAYRENINIEPRQCGGCWWSEPTWMSTCPRGFDDPVCMAYHDPVEIGDRIVERIVRNAPA